MKCPDIWLEPDTTESLVDLQNIKENEDSQSHWVMARVTAAATLKLQTANKITSRQKIRG